MPRGLTCPGWNCLQRPRVLSLPNQRFAGYRIRPMTTTIGQALARSRPRKLFAVLAALAVVAADMAIVRSWESLSGYRWIPPLAALAALWSIAGGDRASLGLSFRPAQGWKYWIVATVAVGAIVAAFSLAVLGIGGFLGWELPVYRRDPASLASALVPMCLAAPVLEELTYRLAVCVPLAALVGPGWTIVASGAVFAAVHFAGGNAGPDNFIAGYILAWAYLKSGSFFLPVLLHALGNLCVLLAQVAAWYLLA